MSLLQNLSSPLVTYEVERTFSKALQEAWISHEEMWIQDTREFYTKLAWGIFEPGWVSARLWELFVTKDWIPQNWIDEFIYKLTRSEWSMDRINNHLANRLYDFFKRIQTRKPQNVWEAHYDIPARMYEIMLWETMKYTSGEWSPEYGNFDLTSSQRLAMEMICQRAELEKSNTWEEEMSVLEVGFWYGTLADHAISNYGVQVTWLTVSDGQKDFAEEYMAKNGTLENADLQNLDWKVIMNSPELLEKFAWKFDRIISIEMIEAVSTKDLPLFFEFLFHCLNDDGILFIQAINSDRLYYTTEGFIDKYIFPDGVVPQSQNLLSCAQRAGFQQEEHDNDIVTKAYDLALMAWHQNLAAWYEEISWVLDYHYSQNHSPSFPFPDDPSFLWIFEYYLKSCAWSFPVRKIGIGS